MWWTYRNRNSYFLFPPLVNRDCLVCKRFTVYVCVCVCLNVSSTDCSVFLRNTIRWMNIKKHLDNILERMEKKKMMTRWQKVSGGLISVWNISWQQEWPANQQSVFGQTIEWCVTGAHHRTVETNDGLLRLDWDLLGLYIDSFSQTAAACQLNTWHQLQTFHLLKLRTVVTTTNSDTQVASHHTNK